MVLTGGFVVLVVFDGKNKNMVSCRFSHHPIHCCCCSCFFLVLLVVADVVNNY